MVVWFQIKEADQNPIIHKNSSVSENSALVSICFLLCHSLSLLSEYAPNRLREELWTARGAVIRGTLLAEGVPLGSGNIGNTRSRTSHTQG